MADFRKWILALVAVAMLISLVPAASAQTTLSCNATATVPPLLRSEGQTELTGDILLNCTNALGGASTIPVLALGNTIPTANITVFYNTNVTSRLLGNGLSEALLLMNNAQPTAANTCTSVTGCYGPGSNVVAANTNNNVLTKTAFEGIVSGNSVTFVGVPVTPPGSIGDSTVTNFSYRLTNVRVDASVASANTGSINGIPVSGLGQIVAFITITGPTAIGVPNPQQGVGFTNKSISFSASPSGSGTFAMCNDIVRTTAQGLLRFQELFPSAFKVRALDAGGVTGGGQTAVGTVYNTESGLVATELHGTNGSATTTVGLADFGTRLKAVFTNIPVGVSVYVSTQNLTTSGSPYTIPGPNTEVAVLLPTSATESGVFSAATATASTFNGPGTTGAALPAYLIGTGSASASTFTAVWEVTAANNLASTSFDFAYYFARTAAPSSPVAAAQVNGGYAPSGNTAGAGITNGGTALSGPVPRFIFTGTPTNVLSLVVCRTNLLFPYVVNVASFDTGLAISNTSVDGLGTTGVPFNDTAEPNTGCSLYFFGDGTPSTNPVPLTVNAGKTAAILASSQAPGFVGYVIAQCQFRFAHGFAYIADSAGGHAAMGYLPLVIPDNPIPGTSGNAPSSRTPNSQPGNGLGEILGN